MNRRDLDQLVAEELANRQHAEDFKRTGFWGRRGAGAVFLARDTGRILLPLRSDRVEQPGTWGTWGGAVDPGEAPEEAVRREVREEAGYLGAVDLIPLLVFRRGDFAYHNYLAVVPSEFIPELNWETDDYAWVTLDDLPEPLHFGLRALLADRASVEKIRAAVGEGGGVFAFFHGSWAPLPIGAELEARENSMRKQIGTEVLLEQARPSDASSRHKSWYMTQDPCDVGRMGGGPHIYEVEPLGSVTPANYDWFERIAQTRSWQPEFDHVYDYAKNYWANAPLTDHPQSEWLTPRIRVVRESSCERGKS